MYFQILNTLKNYKVDEVSISKLDSWFGTRRRAVQNFLNPLQFSIDTGIDESISVHLFVLCTYPDIDVLKVKYVVECPNCDRPFKITSNVSEIPDMIECEECCSKLLIRNEFITIWFELIKVPADNPFKLEALQTERELFSLGKRVASELTM